MGVFELHRSKLFRPRFCRKEIRFPHRRDRFGLQVVKFKVELQGPGEIF